MRRFGLPALALGAVVLLSGCTSISGVAFDSLGDGYCMDSSASEVVYVGLYVTNDSDHPVQTKAVTYGSLVTMEPVDAWIVPIPGLKNTIGVAGPLPPDLPQWEDRVRVDVAELPANSQVQLVVELRTMSAAVDAYARGVVLELDGGTIESGATIGILSPDGAKECIVGDAP